MVGNKQHVRHPEHHELAYRYACEGSPRVGDPSAIDPQNPTPSLRMTLKWLVL